MEYPYHRVVLGGTFDLLHIGHQGILTYALKIGQFVTIGLTTDKFNKIRGKPSFQNQTLRLKNLRQFLSKKNYLKRGKIVFINDIFGTTLTDPQIKAIVATSRLKKVANLINKKRVKNSLPKLEIAIFPYVKDQHGKIISSTRIRGGEINILGESYKEMLLKVAGKRLGDDIRTKLKKPLGKIVSIKSIRQPIISVGDVTTYNLLQAKVKPILSILDGKVGRKGVRFWMRFAYQNDRTVVRVKNPAGQISKSLISAIDQALKKPPTTRFARRANHQPLTILVDGEEDLATIPAILLSPLGIQVLYGQPGKGLVSVKVDLEIKDYLCQLLCSIN